MTAILGRSRVTRSGGAHVPVTVSRALGAAIGDEVEFAVADDGSVAIRKYDPSGEPWYQEHAWFWESAKPRCVRRRPKETEEQ